MHFSRPKRLENHGMTQAALFSLFLITAFSVAMGAIIVIFDQAVVALGHDTDPIVSILVTRHMLIELILGEVHVAMRAKQFLIIFLSFELFLHCLLFKSALVLVGIMDQLLI